MKLSRRNVMLGAGAAMAGLAGARAGAQGSEWFAAVASKLGMTLSEAQLAAGAAFLERHPTVDVHSHPGRFFLRDVVNPSKHLADYGAPFEGRVIEDMRAGRISAGLFAGVSDMSLLEFSPERGLYATREFRPGEAYADYRRQIGVLKGLVDRHLARPGRSAREIRAAHRHRDTACVFAIEGGDFIEDRIERVRQAHDEGVRAITIVHYHVNQIGDIQTEPAHHGGLTPLGAAIIRAMNRTGIIVDLAHAPMSVVRRAVDVSTRPMMISHTNLATPTFDHPRLVSAEQARLVTRHGGLIGSISWGIGQSSFADWIDSILRLADTVGVDHVAIGTDMDATYKPVFTNYRQWALLPAALLAKGLSEPEVARIMGGNFLRLLAANSG